MASTCLHGYPPGTCLICQALDQPAAAKPAIKQRARDGAAKAARAAKEPAPRPRTPAVSSTGPRVVPPEALGLRTSVGLRVIGVVFAVAIALVLAWTALHVVFAVLHILELIAVALIAGYIGWLAGVFHGRRTPGR